MCLYGKLVDNPKFKPNKKNGGFIPPVKDERALIVPIGCGKCIECRQERAREWQIRLLEDIKDNTNGIFVTLTFNTKSLMKLKYDVENYTVIDNKYTKIKRELEGYELDNEIAKRAMRRFNERWRKKYKKAIRHWMITELGHKNTEHVHLHGILYTDENPYEITDKWGYGYTWLGDEIVGKIKNYVNESTVNYITKYISKTDFIHKEYKPIILTSAGIGRGYIKRAKHNKFNGKDTDELYRTSTGHKMSMPIYYRNKIYTDEEKEELWLQKLDKNERWVCGEKVKANDERQYYEILKYHRKRNKELGYGDDEINWDRIEYEKQRRKLIWEARTETDEQKIKKIEWE